MMTPKFYLVLEQAINEGILRGINRYYKHRDGSLSIAEEEELKGMIHNNIMTSLYEWFNMPKGDFDNEI